MRIASVTQKHVQNSITKTQKTLSTPNFKSSLNPMFFRRIHDLGDNNVNYVELESFKAEIQKKDGAELFQYGIDALDNNTLLIVTNDRERSNFVLNRYKDNIDTPIFRSYILDITEENAPYWAEVTDNNFAMYKKDGKYYIMGLGSILGVYIRDTETKESGLLKPGEVRELTSKIEIETSSIKKPTAIKFTIPDKINCENADLYLERKETINTTIHNANAVAAIVQNKNQKTHKTKKDFTFADIGGLDHIIEDLRKFVIRPVNYPEVFENIRLNKGILLYGPPRCGKTLIGKALANEAGIDFRYMNASEFTKSTHGASEEKARDVFKELMEKPAILFIDEIDGIGKQRSGSGNAHYDDKFLTQLLGLMSDLEKSNTTSFVIAATNRKDLLDTALLATGRFGLQLEIPLPNEEGLGQIFSIHARKQNLEKDVNIQEFIPLMLEAKFNGSDVAELITNGYFNALDRLGLNKKMDAKIFNYNDLKSIKISKADLMKAYHSLVKQKI